MADVRKFAGWVFDSDGTTIARVTEFSWDGSTEEEDVTGSEHQTGGIVNRQYETVSQEKTVSISFIQEKGSGAAQDAGQTALETARVSGATVVFRAVDTDGYGSDYTGKVLRVSASGGSGQTMKGTAQLRVNSEAGVTP